MGRAGAGARFGRCTAASLRRWHRRLAPRRSTIGPLRRSHHRRDKCARHADFASIWPVSGELSLAKRGRMPRMPKIAARRSIRTHRAMISERWLSGRKRRFAKSVTGKLVRRFESCPLRSVASGFVRGLRRFGRGVRAHRRGHQMNQRSNRYRHRITPAISHQGFRAGGASSWEM